MDTFLAEIITGIFFLHNELPKHGHNGHLIYQKKSLTKVTCFHTISLRG